MIKLSEYLHVFTSYFQKYLKALAKPNGGILFQSRKRLRYTANLFRLLLIMTILK